MYNLENMIYVEDLLKKMLLGLKFNLIVELKCVRLSFSIVSFLLK
ncbi:hypothetical protein AGMMS49531_10940 [Endomicrobiia bacterium]|nr:hypothetical protein AGMMS49531_10940 [Endomicrobiia bacterium]